MKGKKVEANDDDDRKEDENSHLNLHRHRSFSKEAHVEKSVVVVSIYGWVEGRQGDETGQEPEEQTE